MSFTNTDFGPGGQGLPQGQISCANGHPNSGTAKFCSTCGVAMPEPIITQHESIDSAKRGEGPFMFECTNGHPCHESVTTCFVCGAPVRAAGYFTCPQGHFTKVDIGPDGTRYCATCYKAIDPAQLPSDQVHPSLITGKPVPNKPMQRTNAFGTSTQGEFTGTPDERDRPKVMILWLWWFVFSPVVWFMAPSYASKAKRLGFRETARYWVVWWISVLPALALIALFIWASVAANNANSSSGYRGLTPYSAPTTQTYAPPTTRAYVPPPLATPESTAGSAPATNAFYPVAQGSDTDSTDLAHLILSAGSSRWARGGYPTAVTCERNTDGTVDYHFNCNITFSATGRTTSYWCDWDGYEWSATQRLHQ